MSTAASGLSAAGDETQSSSELETESERCEKRLLSSKKQRQVLCKQGRKIQVLLEFTTTPRAPNKTPKNAQNKETYRMLDSHNYYLFSIMCFGCFKILKPTPNE